MCAHTCEMIEICGTSLLGHGPSWCVESSFTQPGNNYLKEIP